MGGTHRRRVAVGVVAIALALVGCDSGSLGQRVASAPPAPSPDHVVMPARSPRAGQPDCDPRDLVARFAGHEGATGTTIRYFAIRSSSEVECWLEGRVSGLSGVDVDGRRVDLPVRQAPSIGGEPGLLLPSAQGGLTLLWYGRCDDGVEPARRRTFHDLLFTYRGVKIAVEPAESNGEIEDLVDLGCLPVGDPVDVTPFSVG